MGKLTLATRLADDLGTSVAEASRFVDDVGASRARGLIDEASGGGRVSNWWKAGAGGTAIGGGALAWREQDVRRAEAMASQQQSYGDALTTLVEADLPPDVKQSLAASLAEQGAGSAGGGSSGGDGGDSQPDDGGLVPDDPQTLIILVIVLVFVLKFALEGGDD